MTAHALLEVRGLDVRFRAGRAAVHAVRGVDLDVPAEGVVGIVGESGSGKSATMMAVLGLLPPTAAVAGSVRFEGDELLGTSHKHMRRLRGASIAMVFQDPLTSLNRVMTIGAQISEAIRVHDRSVSRKEGRRRAIELLELVAIPAAAQRVDAYPFELSGGMRQRIGIAMAMANDPALLIADEPTTALDVTIQSQVLEILRGIQGQRRVGIVLVSHDLGVIADMADRVAVMYAGRIVEHGDVEDVFYEARHPYTRALLDSQPRFDQPGRRLVPISGAPPSMANPPAGCAFHPRCPLAEDHCRIEDPRARSIARTQVACHRAGDAQAAGAVNQGVSA
jgi:oligopeptide/dipeptide ABC transporter ATP-binding protein